MIREAERRSIRTFLEANAALLAGRVLDYGCGRQPYRDVVEAAGGDYYGFDRAAFLASTVSEDVGFVPFGGERWDAIVCTQVIQYVPYPSDLLERFEGALGGDADPVGALLLTYPTTWPVVEDADLWRFTPAGIETLLDRAHFDVVSHSVRHTLDFRGFVLPVGGAVVARRRP